MSHTPVVTDALYSTMGGDPDLGELVDLFVQEMPNRASQLIERLDRGNWEGLRQAAHRLKGAAGSYGFDPITPSAARVEMALCQGEPEEEIRRVVNELVNLCSLARAGTPE